METWKCKILVDNPENKSFVYKYIDATIMSEDGRIFSLRAYGVFSDGSSRRLDENSWYTSLNSAKRGFKDYWDKGRAKWIKTV